MDLMRFKPALPKYGLMALAGLLWTTVGIGLCRLGLRWVSVLPVTRAVPIGTAGLVLALVAYRFSFSGIAAKNITRLCQFPAKSCLFAFQAWRSYLIIGVMILLGVIMRHSQIPKIYLAPVYFAVGGALILSSCRYYAFLWRTIVLKAPCSPDENERRAQQ